jgi:hypothetical protein
VPSRSLTKQKSVTGKKPALGDSRNGRFDKTPLVLDFDHSGFRNDVEFALSRGGELSPLAVDHVRAEFVLRYRFPAEFVAFIDEITIEDGSEHLRRSIVSHGPSLSDVTRAVDKLDPDDQRRVMLIFVEPAGDGRTRFPTVLPEHS